MELGVVLLALAVLAVPVLGLVGFIRSLALARRVETMELRLAAAEALLGTAVLRATPDEQPLPGAQANPSSGETGEGPETVPEGGGPETAGAEQAPEAAGIQPPVEPEPEAFGPPEAVGPAPLPPRAPPRSLEEVAGTRWAVWVGGVALGLGAIFLVRYSIEQGWFGPGARVALGGLFALLLAAAGEGLRRRERRGGAPVIAGPAAAHVPSVLTSAATLAAFATVYAAHALYGMLGPAAAFILLGIVGLAALLAAAIHGPTLAAVGLVASFAAPLLVSSEEPDAWPVVIYICVVAAAGYALARLRLWRWLAIATAIGVGLWAVLLLAGPNRFEAPLLFHLVVQSAIATLFLAVLPYAGHRDDDGRPDILALGVLGALSLLACASLGSFEIAGPTRVVVASALVAGLLAAAWSAAPAAAAGLFAGVVTCAALWTWPVAAEAARESAPILAGPLVMPPMPDALWLFLAAGTGLGGALAASGFVRLMRGERLGLLPASLHAAAATAAPLLILVLAWLRVTSFDRSIPFSLVALGLAAAFAGIAGVFARKPDDSPATLVGLEVFAAGALAALGLGLAIALEKNALTVALSLAALGAAWVTSRTGLGLLRIGVGILAVATAARFVADPAAGIAGVGATPVFNALLWTYGVPAIAFWLSARILAGQGETRVVGLCEALAVSLAGLLVAFELRHWFSGGDLFASRPGHLETGLDVFVALLASAVLAGLAPGRTSLVLRAAALVYGGLGAAGALLGLLGANNPLFHGASEAVQGGPVLDSLLAAYGLPALAALWLARRARGLGQPSVATAAWISAGVLGLSWLILEIRRLFQGPNIAIWRPTGDPEMYTYTAALLVVGLGFLAYGLLRGSRAARLASAVAIVLAVGKAFLFDMSGMEGPLRALSFIGLGIVLVGIGLVYQKLVFGRRPPAEPPQGPARATGPS